ncbi:2-amino-4-hydroxy-6-hydroxymethyldihydropteridine diphosphokinase [Panacibacter sp. DH6]|uniref:2-amino-4-hydroxy-6-hydroxymethyldihydropteridine pyrophosphokinase n=1 Tax=Panacibacter microcysteis TaxID=2793269 RepID=A0A931E7S1_9BACT|nr:2-amino-4-hydroxy-6-hydroxymethyldihydropteridine diphosphokinase [Panacibacter microcysteis]MBG9376941.1 2-amino-4-hydroxy-6-hydroxymethyldihydropteridine diphosphokinase [Panacibacter microcysteis]
MNKAYLLTGGNLGDRAGNLAMASAYIQQYCGTIVQKSCLYETAAWGLQDQPDFYNQAILLETDLTAPNLMEILLRIEYKMGRTRTVKMGPRIIDIDMLFYNTAIMETATLIIPHPRMQERRFVLMPLAEIAPQYVHPVFHKTIVQLLEACKDELNVYKIEQ